MGVIRILKFSSRNGKLPLTQRKQGNYPVISVYANPLSAFCVYTSLLDINDMNEALVHDGKFLVWFVLSFSINISS